MENKNTWKLQFKANVIASFKQLEKMHLSQDKVKEKLHDFLMYSRNQIYIKSTLRGKFTMNNADGIVYSTHSLHCFTTQFTKGIMQIQCKHTPKISAKSNLHVTQF